MREVREEAGVRRDVVRWTAGVDPAGPSTGMHAFVVERPAGSAWEGERRIPEGLTG